MTKDELRKHCKKMCRWYSCVPDSSAYEEHKLILELLDQDEAITKASILNALEDVRAEIEDIDGITEIGAQILDEVLGIINRKIKEIKHDT